jgi:hypothetical protein
MGLTPRQIVVRAQETAWQMLSALERGGLVANFLDSYAREFKRPTSNVHPGHYTEMSETIRRESLLEMVMYVEAEFPRRLGILTRQRRKQRSKKRAARKQARVQKSARQLIAERQMVDLFRQEFYVALGKALGWRKEEFGEFWRDHEIYQQLGAGQSREKKKRAPIIEGPFVDRCAFLLDPSFLETARRAAGKFRAQLHNAAAAVLRKAFMQRREN